MSVLLVSPVCWMDVIWRCGKATLDGLAFGIENKVPEFGKFSNVTSLKTSSIPHKT
jgi:hypothetical protein